MSVSNEDLHIPGKELSRDDQSPGIVAGWAVFILKESKFATGDRTAVDPVEDQIAA
jgi:hypothetical protein